MDKSAKQVVVLLAHPDIKSSQANKALADAIKELEEVAIYNLYEMKMFPPRLTVLCHKVSCGGSIFIYHLLRIFPNI